MRLSSLVRCTRGARLITGCGVETRQRVADGADWGHFGCGACIRPIRPCSQGALLQRAQQAHKEPQQRLHLPKTHVSGLYVHYEVVHQSSCEQCVKEDTSEISFQE